MNYGGVRAKNALEKLNDAQKLEEFQALNKDSFQKLRFRKFLKSQFLD